MSAAYCNIALRLPDDTADTIRQVARIAQTSPEQVIATLLALHMQRSSEPSPADLDAPRHPDAIDLECEDAVIHKIQARRAAGRAKYGHTMERTDLNLVDWLRHAQEEAMDHAIYLQRALREAITARQQAGIEAAQ